MKTAESHGSKSSRQTLLTVQLGDVRSEFVRDAHIEALFDLGLNVEIVKGKTLAAARARLVAFLERWKLSFDLRELHLFGQGATGAVVGDLSLAYPSPLGGVIVSSGSSFLTDGWRARVSASAFFTPRLILQGAFGSSEEVERGRHEALELSAIGLPVTFRELNKDWSFDAETELPLIRAWLKARAASRVRKLPAARVHQAPQPTLVRSLSDT